MEVRVRYMTFIHVDTHIQQIGDNGSQITFLPNHLIKLQSDVFIIADTIITRIDFLDR
jgi:hypothetical protein